MGKEVVSEYEFVQVGEHKSHLLMNVLNKEALEAEMTSDAAKEWDQKNNCKDTVYGIELVGWFNLLIIDRRSKVEVVLNLFFMSSSMKDFLNKFFDLCREYQEEIPPQKMAEVLRDYADRLDG